MSEGSSNTASGEFLLTTYAISFNQSPFLLQLDNSLLRNYFDFFTYDHENDNSQKADVSEHQLWGRMWRIPSGTLFGFLAE